MASTYTTGFGIEKIAASEQAETWGTTTNHNLDIIDRIASYKAVAISGATHTLTVREASPGSGTENLQDGMYRVIKFTGALGGNNTVTIAPNTSPAWFIIENATTDSGSSGPYSVILTQGSGANVTVQNGKNAIIYCDGAGSGAAVVNALADLQVATLSVTGAASAASLTLTTDLAVADGGTGASSLTDGGVLLGSGTGAITPMAVLTDGQMIVGDGTGDPVAESGATLRASIGVDPAGTDNSTNVTLAGSLDYLTLSGQEITRGAIVLTTDVSGTLPVANGGSGATSLTDGGILLGSGTGAITAMAVLSDGQMIVGDGTGDPVAESGATLRTSIGVDAAGTDNSTNVTLAGSLDYLTISGQEITRGAIVLTTDVSGTLPIANGGTNATSAGAALTSLGAAARGANSDITSLTGLTTDLTVAQGGTGAGTFAANGILYGNGTSAIGATAVGTDGHVLTSNGSGVAPTFQAAAGGGATDIDGLSDALTNSSGATIGLGTGALAADDGSANNNTALGYQALNDATTASRNVAVGYQSLDNLTTSFGYSTAVGYQALDAATTGYGNTAIGDSALKTITTTHHNTAIGRDAGSLAVESNCVMIGKSAGKKANTGSVVIGYDALESSSNSKTATAIGYTSLKANTSGDNNTAVGFESLLVNTTGSHNTSLGYGAGSKITTGAGNTIIGSNAGTAGGPATTSNNTFVGYYSGRFNPGGNNTLVGQKSGYGVSGSTTTAAVDNSSFGVSALQGVTTGQGNTTIGKDAGIAITTGIRNTFLGNTAGSTTTTGINNTILGAQGAASSATVSNEITLGNAEVTSFRIPGVGFYSLSGNVGIGTASPAVPLDCVGNIRSSTGILFGTDTAAANLLDDYEEGDWTPTIGTGTTVSSDAAYNASFTAGKYTKVGRVVHCSATLRLTDKGTQSGAISILGLPFTSANNAGSRVTWSCWFHQSTDIDLTGNTTGTIMMYQAGNTAYILVRVKDPATTGAENVEFADISDTMYLQISGSYIAA